MSALPPTPASTAGLRGDLTDGTLLRIATFRLARRLRSHRAVSTMSDPQFAVLAALYTHGEHTLGSLAERERVSAPSMNRTVNGLEEAGYIARSAHENDGRKVNIALTALGEDVVAETVRRRDAWLDIALTELSDDERETLKAAAVIMRKVADR